MKQKLTVLLAIGLLIAAAVVGVIAVKFAPGHSGGTTRSADPRPGASPSPSGTPSPSSGTSLDPAADLVIPKSVVNPLKGRHYCQTAKLLAVYTKQGYGLNADLGVVDGKRFDDRLRTIAGAFARLAQQAPGQPKAGAAAPHWQRLADATTKAEEQLRVFGLRAQSQAMIAELARWKQLSTTELPRATATLKATCGLSPAIFGI